MYHRKPILQRKNKDINHLAVIWACLLALKEQKKLRVAYVVRGLGMGDVIFCKISDTRIWQRNEKIVLRAERKHLLMR